MSIVCRIRRRWLNPKTEKLQLGKASCTSTEEPICMVNKVIASEHQAASTSSSRLESREAILPRANHCERASNTLRDVKRIRPKKARGPSFFYSIKRKRLWFIIYSLRWYLSFYNNINRQFYFPFLDILDHCRFTSSGKKNGAGEQISHSFFAHVLVREARYQRYCHSVSL